MRRDHVIGVALAVAVLAVFGPALRYGFVDYDDPEYLLLNPHMQRGLTPESVAWAFTSLEQNNWHPLTWLSHLADVSLFGWRPGGHHLTSLLLHAANSVLLYFVLKRLTRAVWPSAFVAALFALHPMHVESVVWVSERKDVLSTLFWLLAMLAYARYAARPGAARYALVAALMALGLAAKPMLVTLPLVLLLLDAWPLGRLKSRADLGRLALEKAPLVVLSAVSSLVTLAAQQGAMFYAQDMPLSLRLANAAVSCATYVARMFWPSGLAVLYPYPPEIPAWQWAAAGATLAALTAAALMEGRRRPYLAVGWLWFLVTLVPVLGLVQVGLQSMADRYTYVPFIGLFIAVAWGAADAAAARLGVRRAAGPAAAVVLLACAALSARQVTFWQDSKTLFQRALDVTPDNALMEFNLGVILNDEGRRDEAVEHWLRAVRIAPRHAPALTNLGMALLERGLADKAIPYFEAALNVSPLVTEAHFGLGMAHARLGRTAEAIEEYHRTLRCDPRHAGAASNLGALLAYRGDVAAGVALCRQAVEWQPRNPRLRGNLGLLLLAMDRPEEALAHLEEAARREAGSAAAHVNLGLAMLRVRNLDGAAAAYAAALKIAPDLPDAHVGLGSVAWRRGDPAEAARGYREALRLDPDHPLAAGNLAWLLATCPDAALRNGAEAVTLAERVCTGPGRREPGLVDALAAAYAEAGRFPEAVAAARDAAALAAALGKKTLAQEMEERRKLYEAGRPYRESTPPRQILPLGW